MLCEPASSSRLARFQARKAAFFRPFGGSDAHRGFLDARRPLHVDLNVGSERVVKDHQKIYESRKAIRFSRLETITEQGRTMSEQGEFKDLASEMIEQYFPHEMETWELSKDSWISQLYRTENIRTPLQKGAGENFTAEQIHAVIEGINAIVATFKAYKYIRSLINEGQSPNRDKLLEAWQKYLVEKGISESKSEQISKGLYTKFKHLSDGKK